MTELDSYLVRSVNQGPWLSAYTLPELLRNRDESRYLLPICSLGTPWESLVKLVESERDLLLPPLYHEAFANSPAVVAANPADSPQSTAASSFKGQVLDRIRHCFPFYEGTSRRRDWKGSLELVELPAQSHSAPTQGGIIAFSVDTAVEEHGPHLPLATDTIQSYAVLESLANEYTELHLAPPVEYGHLTWGLPFGMSVDLTPQLLTVYVQNYVDALVRWLQPRGVYVVDVHGSIVHRQAIEAGLEASGVSPTRFRWLHEPLVEFAGARGDQHAGGVETALVELISANLPSDLVDTRWWPERLEDLAREQMSMDQAIALSQDLPAFLRHVEDRGGNGIVGNVRNYHSLDANELMRRMLEVARDDIQSLLSAG